MIHETTTPEQRKAGNAEVLLRYQEMAQHYGTVIIPARVKKPRDKSKVETGVQIAERQILAALRDQRFFSVVELNAAMAPLLAKLNAKSFQKLEGSRDSWFESLEKPQLLPPPPEPFDLAVWSKAKVNIDYHVVVETGKSYLSCALGAQGCRDGYRTQYYHAPKLFRDLEIARADGSLSGLLTRLARTRLLVVDDLGIASVSGKLYREFLEILDDRQGQGSTVITSQFPVDQWHEVIGHPTVADAILDRLVHNAYRVELKGESMRKPKTPPAEGK